MLPEKPALLVLSGLLCDEQVWAPVSARLSDVARVRSFCFPDFSSIGSMAVAVLAEAPAEFAVAGHSMGGRVALEIVRRAAHRVTGLALLNTGVHPPAAHEPEKRAPLLKLARSAGMRAVADAWLPGMMGQPYDPADAAVARLIRMVEHNTPESFEAQVHALLHRPDATPVLSTIRVPTLLLSGDLDSWSPPAQHEQMRQLVPDADLRIVDKAGHMTLTERPAEVAAALRTWLDRISVRRAGRL